MIGTTRVGWSASERTSQSVEVMAMTVVGTGAARPCDSVFRMTPDARTRATGAARRGSSTCAPRRLERVPAEILYQRATWCSITPSPPLTGPTPGSDPANVPNGWR